MAINLQNVSEETGQDFILYQAWLEWLDDQDIHAVNAIAGISLKYEVYPNFVNIGRSRVLCFIIYCRETFERCEFLWSEIASNPIRFMEDVEAYFLSLKN